MINTYEDWLAQVAEPGDYICHTDEFYKCYKEKSELARRFAPKAKVIAEIGVRSGYSAHAFMSSFEDPKAYFGYDLFEIYGANTPYEWNGGPKNIDKILRRDFPDTMVCIVQANSQKFSFIGLKDVDWFHVDGDHTHNGCFHDMNIAWPTVSSGGIMLVDDYDHVPDVKDAVDRFVCFKEEEIASYEYVKTLRGDMVIVKK